MCCPCKKRHAREQLQKVVSDKYHIRVLGSPLEMAHLFFVGSFLASGKVVQGLLAGWELAAVAARPAGWELPAVTHNGNDFCTMCCSTGRTLPKFGEDLKSMPYDIADLVKL